MLIRHFGPRQHVTVWSANRAQLSRQACGARVAQAWPDDRLTASTTACGARARVVGGHRNPIVEDAHIAESGLTGLVMEHDLVVIRVGGPIRLISDLRARQMGSIAPRKDYHPVDLDVT